MKMQFDIVGWLYFALLIGTRVAAVEIAERIIGGSNARRGEFPFHAALKIKHEYLCGGTIITRRHVLSAAHCMRYIIENYNYATVVTGTNYYDRGEEFHVSIVYEHINFDDVTKLNDIAIVMLDRSIHFNAYQAPIHMARHDNYTNYYGTIIGWGYTKPKLLSRNLKKARVRILSNPNCIQRMPPYTVLTGLYANTQKCTLENNIGVCFGDSGGSLIVDNTLIGITSGGFPCAAGLPDIYTNIFAYRRWIANIIRHEPY